MCLSHAGNSAKDFTCVFMYISPYPHGMCVRNVLSQRVTIKWVLRTYALLPSTHMGTPAPWLHCLSPSLSNPHPHPLSPHSLSRKMLALSSLFQVPNHSPISQFYIPPTFSTKVGKKSKGGKYIVIFPPKCKCLPPSLPLPVTAPPFLPTSMEEMWVIPTLILSLSLSSSRWSPSSISLPYRKLHQPTFSWFALPPPPPHHPCLHLFCQDSFDPLLTGLSSTMHTSDVYNYNITKQSFQTWTFTLLLQLWSDMAGFLPSLHWWQLTTVGLMSLPIHGRVIFQTRVLETRGIPQLQWRVSMEPSWSDQDDRMISGWLLDH